MTEREWDWRYSCPSKLSTFSDALQDYPHQGESSNTFSWIGVTLHMPCTEETGESEQVNRRKGDLHSV